MPILNPLQTERFYDALKSLGAIPRQVMLPLADHGHRSCEAIGRVLWGRVRVCGLHLKGVSGE